MKETLLVMLWSLPHWKQLAKVTAWFKKRWARRPMSRGLLNTNNVTNASVVYLEGSDQPHTVSNVNETCLTLTQPEQRNSIVHTQVSFCMPWSVFRRQVRRVNLRRVWSW